jgi:hypothetical protein
MADYSSSYFSLNGASPDFLPKRIRLADKTTRYSNDITLEEIFSIGYAGPIEVPEYNKETECIIWDSNNLKFIIKQVTQEQLDIAEDKKVRDDIKKLISDITKKFEKKVTSSYVIEANKYIAVLSSLLERSTLLSSKDIPEFIFNDFIYIEDSQVAINSWLAGSSAITNYKLWYETFGFIPNFPPEFVDYFTVPSGWSQKIDTSVSWTVIPCSGTLPSISGYNTVTNDSNYNFTSAESVSLVQYSIFFP